MSDLLRTFIAIELDSSLQAALGKIQQALQESGADVKWVKPSNIHLTLNFLGDIRPKKLKEAEELLPGLLNDFASFEISVNRLGAFPTLERARVIWAGVEKNAEMIKRLAAVVENDLCTLGFGKEDREFSAHITLGRVRSAKNLHALAEAVKAYSFKRDLCQTITHIILFQSTLTSQGPIYTPLLKINLK